ncbi:hypothetical protein ACQ4PT_012516 [Festuca glaucescens]
MEGFSTQQQSYCHPHEPLLAGFPACCNLEAAAAMAYECSTSSPTLSMVMQQLHGSFPPSFGAEAAAAGGGDNGRRMVSIEASLVSAQEMQAASISLSWSSAFTILDGSGGKMISRKNKRSNANVAGVTGKRAGRGLGGVGAVDDAKVEEEAAGYVHVRARRGQATDRHSVAERLRRERIGEKMKMLQSLVPGCHKLTGKVLLDEIINYVQSLQSQVEFLSMRLATLNPTMVYELGLDIGSVCHPDAPQLSTVVFVFEIQVVKTAEMPPHELVQWMGQATGTASLAEAQGVPTGATGFVQDGSSNRVMQQVQRLQEEELNNCLSFFQQCN